MFKTLVAVVCLFTSSLFASESKHSIHIIGAITDVGLACQKPLEEIKSKVLAINESLTDHDLNIQIKNYSWYYIAGNIDNQGRATHVGCHFELQSENSKYTIETEAIHREGWSNQNDKCVINEDEKNKVNSDSRAIYAFAQSGLGIAFWNKCVVYKYVIKEKN